MRRKKEIGGSDTKMLKHYLQEEKFKYSNLFVFCCAHKHNKQKGGDYFFFFFSTKINSFFQIFKTKAIILLSIYNFKNHQVTINYHLLMMTLKNI